jgi:predicted dehydrogenase
VRCAIKAGQLVREGRIGQVVQTLGLGPHREGDRAHLAGGEGRPEWFYDRDRTGGIITDIASHQIDQFLWFTGAEQADVVSSAVANYTHPESPKMQDFGEAMLRTDNAHGYIRVDWYTPQGLPTWGDGRLVILGTEGYIELRKYVDLAGRPGGDHLFVVDAAGTEYVDCSDVVLSYYPDLVNDVINRTETACPQRHTFEVMRLAITAQQSATMMGFAT